MAEEKEKKKKFENVSVLMKNCVVSTKHIREGKVKEIISISPSIDDILGGGIESGSLCLIVGKEKLGKTSTCLHIAKKLQQAGYNIVYCNVEMRLSKRDISSAIGLDEDEHRLRIVMSTEDHIMSGQDYLSIADQIFSTEKRVAIFIDSFSQMISQDNLEGDLRDMSRDSMPLILSKFCKRVMPYLYIHDNICVGITHEVANTSGYGSTISETSGRKIQYANNFKLRLAKSESWEEGQIRVGQIMHWECKNSALGPPGKTSLGYLRYNEGIDEEYELLVTAHALQLVKKAGVWYYFGEDKACGVAGGVTYLREHPETFQQIRKEVLERLGSYRSIGE